MWPVQEKKDVPRATVELIVRSPDGRPLANAQVDVRSGEHFFPNEKRPSAAAKTDAQGRISFSWPVGLHRLDVMVGGIGYGATGRFELLEGDTVRPALAPLVPFGAIEGVVPKDSLQPYAYVEFSGMSDRASRLAACDKAGRFVFENLPAGEYDLALRPIIPGVSTLTRVAVPPGQRIRNVVIHKEKDTRVNPMELVEGVRKKEKAETKCRVAGTVRDETGQPIEGADVFVPFVYAGGRWAYDVIESARTGKDGRWQLTSSGSLTSLDGAIIAHKAGRPYTYLPLHDPATEEDCDQSTKPDLRVFDLVLPSRGGNLEVTVLREGKPLKQASVTIKSGHGASLHYYHYPHSESSSNRDVVENLLASAALPMSTASRDSRI